MQEGRFVKPGRSVMIAHQTSRNKDNILCVAAVIAVDFSKLSCFSDKKYGELVGDPVCFMDLRRSFRLDN